MVLPEGGIIVTENLEVVDEADLPTLTYKLDFIRGRCAGMVGGRRAIEQAIFKILQTVRFAHLIYSDDYGFENMMGYEELFARAELPRRIEESLFQDERITAIENMNLEFNKDEVMVTFTAITNYGDVEVLREGIPFV
ncbi:DUF2634 domain-containing protein [Cytobacillus purgationiresistens]|uniref:DUF2634 domain-containing protein n=1 Tax=Cytobacillus purgationiresistens TaxID=863449 RepID=A0ABU0AGD0_9BACI|nr:DUF2634 domain-containing protein [Cytobacillus purgationiresistens]MDQ0269929.1 hypothetical protein [Cytobacillus purgationiresistens]